MAEQLFPTVLSDQTVICGALASRCICDRPPRHQGPHACRCGGSWEGEWDMPTFQVRSLPNIDEGPWPLA